MKPAYRVPTLKEVAALRGRSGLTAISTFSGCGGSCLGLEMAGFDLRAASEFVEAARETYRLNHPGVAIDPRDIRQVKADDLLALAGVAPGQLDLFEGSPPCASFSTAGKREKGWGKVKAYSDREQRSDDLFFEWARLLEDLRPRAFVAENVSGLVKGSAKGYFKLIMERLRAAGYAVGCKLLDAQWLGVPQVRQRVIFIGFRSDLGIDPDDAFPQPFRFQYSVREAFVDLPSSIGDPFNGSMVGMAVGSEWAKLRPGGQSERYFSLVRVDPSRPCPTVTASGGTRSLASVAHPHEPRKFTLAELRRLCGFPDDFVLTGTYEQRWERLGRAVPPPMMRAVGEGIIRCLSKSPGGE